MAISSFDVFEINNGVFLEEVPSLCSTRGCRGADEFDVGKRDPVVVADGFVQNDAAVAEDVHTLGHFVVIHGEDEALGGATLNGEPGNYGAEMSVDATAFDLGQTANCAEIIVDCVRCLTVFAAIVSPC